jgi:hypothetical protein
MYDMVWYGVVWCDMVWHGMVWFDVTYPSPIVLTSYSYLDRSYKSGTFNVRQCHQTVIECGGDFIRTVNDSNITARMSSKIKIRTIPEIHYL